MQIHFNSIKMVLVAPLNYQSKKLVILTGLLLFDTEILKM